jgi:hypothetical protein
MNIRIIGLPEQVKAAVAKLRQTLDVTEVSAAYPCCGDSRNVRVYLQVRI